MKYFLRGLIFGGGFVITYLLANLEGPERWFQSLGALYHPVKAAVMFTVGYWLRAAASPIK
jgi:hypothetical protein